MEIQNQLKQRPPSEGEQFAEKLAGELNNYSHTEQVLAMKKLQQLVLSNRFAMAKEITDHIAQQSDLLADLNKGSDAIAQSFEFNAQSN